MLHEVINARYVLHVVYFMNSIKMQRIKQL